LQAKQLPTVRPVYPTNFPRPWHLLQKTSPASTSATAAEAANSIPNSSERSLWSNVVLIGFILAAPLRPRQRPRLLRLPCARDSRPTLQTDDHACVSQHGSRGRTFSARIVTPSGRDSPITQGLLHSSALLRSGAAIPGPEVPARAGPCGALERSASVRRRIT